MVFAEMYSNHSGALITPDYLPELTGLPVTFLQKRKIAEADLGKGWKNLPGCEYNIQLSISKLEKWLSLAKKAGKSRKLALFDWLVYERENILGLSREYLQKTLVDPVSYEGVMVADSTRFRLWAHNLRLVDTEEELKFFEVRAQINDYERKGVVKRRWQMFEELVAICPVGTAFILTSPAGKTGLPDQPDYPYSRTYVLQITDESCENKKTYKRVAGVDIKSDLSLEEHRLLVNSFLPAAKQYQSAVDEMDLAESIATDYTNLHLMREVEKVLQVMEKNRPQTKAKKIYQGQSFALARTELKEIFSQAQDLDPKYQQAFTEFTQVVLTPGARPEIEIKQALALMILELFKIQSPRAVESSQIHYQVHAVPLNLIQQSSARYYVADEYRQAYEVAKQTSGSCPSTSSADLFKDPLQTLLQEIETAIGLRGNPAIPGLGLQLSSESNKCVECPFCKKIVDAIVTWTEIKCPNCGKSKKK